MWQVIISALSLGFVSSFHCVGMCGPIALALPVYDIKGTAGKTLAVVLYHTGRIVTYALLGLIFGLLGRQLYIAGLQQWFSIVAGAIILLVIIQQQFLRKYAAPGLAQKLFYKIQGYIRYVWGKTTLFKFIFIGMLNGLLPCGMVYFALAATLSLSTVQQSVLFMAVFGAGTLPLMAGVHFFGVKYLSIGARNKLRKAVPVFMASVGLLLILRGLNLGIPFLSPYIGRNPGQAIICH